MKGKSLFLRSVMTAAMVTSMLTNSMVFGYAADVPVEDGKGTGNTTLTGEVSAVTTIDVTIPVGGINFAIDADGNIASQGIIIQSNTAIPLKVNVLSAQALDAGDETSGLAATTTKAPNLVKVDMYTTNQWNNLTKAETAENIALALKQVDVVTNAEMQKIAGTALTEATTDTLKVATPVQLGGLTAGDDVLAHLESGFGDASECAINLETDSTYTNYGKAWVGNNDITFRYLTTLEFVFE